ncbi:MAG: DUF4065 domain-containing protein [Clostridiales bacterium]|jgi:putative zinc finger/helix-turn-helix YgiT family protein|nr:DUF4065 domain-containing protein [Clostridiales bacterium]
MMPKCELCGGEESTVIRKQEVLSVRGEDIETVSYVSVCKCGNELFDEKLDEENLSRAYDMYRVRHNVITSEEIKETRERYGLSQRALGRVLGWGDVTIHRYETGALPDNSHGKMLRLIEDPKVMKKLLLEAQASIPRSTFQRVMERIETLLGEREAEVFMDMLERRIQSSTVDIESGFKQFDLDKFLNVILFFAQHATMLWITKLNKLLFYSDFRYFKNYTISMTGLKYKKLDYGPVPDNYDMLLGSLHNLKFIEITPHCIGQYSGSIITPLINYDPRAFTKEELEILKEVKRELGDDSSFKLSDTSHQEKAWSETPYCCVISYDYAMELN